MLDKTTKDIEPAPGWRFLQFLGFGNNRDTAVEPKAKKPPKEPEERKHQFATWYIFAAFLAVMLIQSLWLSFTQVETIPYSQFEQLLAENKISEVLVGTETIEGTLKEPFPDGRKLFHTVRVDPGLADKLKEHGVTITGAPSSSFLSTILSWVLPIFIFYLIWTYGIRHMAERQGFGGLMAIGKSRAKVYVETDTKVTFRDAAGARGRRRGGRAVFLDLGRPVRRDVRRRRRRARPRPVRAGAEGGPLHHLHRRARRTGAKPHARRVRRLRREGADAQPAARRARRFRSEHRRDPARRHQPPGGARSGPAAARALRPPGAGRPAGPLGAAGNPEGSCCQGSRRGRCRSRPDRRVDDRLHRRRYRQPGQRGRHLGDAAQGRRGDARRFHRGDRTHRRGA